MNNPSFQISETLASRAQTGTAAIVVLYYPDAGTLDYLPELAHCVDHLILVDNTPSQSPQRDWGPRVDYIANGANLGIATALNQGLQKAASLGTDLAFLFDQDSRTDRDFFKNMIKFKTALQKNVVICAPDFLDVNTGVLSSFARLNRWTYTTVSCKNNPDPVDVTFVITSGSLLDMAHWKHIGTFRDDYFIDHVDSEYCLRAATEGLRVVVNPGVVLKHAIGKRSLHRILGLTIKPNHHNPIRRYYIARNGVRTTLDYMGRMPSVFTLNAARMIHDLLGILFFEQDRWRKLRATVLGIVDGFRNRMGQAPASISKL